MKRILILAATFLGFSSCDKSNQSSIDHCEELTVGIITNNETVVRKTVNELIAQLGSVAYTEQNIAALVAAMESNCTIEATLDCFDCIKTLPSATELNLKTGAGITKKVDLSYDNSNNMVFRNMHE